MKSVAVMQPYFFPYLGYYQLAFHANQFVFLDNVSFIKGGYINRNSILLNGVAHRFTLPVKDISSFRHINDHHYLPDHGKLALLLKHAYGKAPFFKKAIEVVMASMAVIPSNVAEVNAKSITETFAYLGLSRTFSTASSMPLCSGLIGEERIIDICKQTSATHYVNAPGGRNLYQAETFAGQGFKLGFIVPSSLPYHQHQTTFTANLSMIDVLMWNHPEQVIDLLGQYHIDYNHS